MIRGEILQDRRKAPNNRSPTSPLQQQPSRKTLKARLTESSEVIIICRILHHQASELASLLGSDPSFVQSQTQTKSRGKVGSKGLRSGPDSGKTDRYSPGSTRVASRSATP